MCPVDTPSHYDDDPWSYCYRGDTVYMAVAGKANDYVDEQKVTLKENQCFVGVGKFKYTNKRGDEKTIRKIKIVEDTAASVGGQNASK